MDTAAPDLECLHILIPIFSATKTSKQQFDCKLNGARAADLI